MGRKSNVEPKTPKPMAVKPRLTRSQKEASSPAVTTRKKQTKRPAAEDEIETTGAMRRKRGRPRKIESMDETEQSTLGDETNEAPQGWINTETPSGMSSRRGTRAPAVQPAARSGGSPVSISRRSTSPRSSPSIYRRPVPDHASLPERVTPASSRQSSSTPTAQRNSPKQNAPLQSPPRKLNTGQPASTGLAPNSQAIANILQGGSKSTHIVVSGPDSSTTNYPTRTFSGTVVSSQDGKAVRVKVTPSSSVNLKSASVFKQTAASDHNYNVPEVAEWKKRMQKSTLVIERLKKDQKRLRTKLSRANKRIEKLMRSLILEQRMHNETQQTLRAIMQSLQLEVVTGN